MNELHCARAVFLVECLGKAMKYGIFCHVCFYCQLMVPDRVNLLLLWYVPINLVDGSDRDQNKFVV
jgi:hypothetical protein